MSGIDRGDSATFQLLHAGRKVSLVVDAAEARHVVDEVSAVKSSIARQDSDGSLRMSWKMQDGSLQPIPGHVKALIDQQVRREPA